ncbi:protein WVD2-like 7 isoform X2 [Papaver somniferum]|uniref:protein WVD2-like 7 isoform X2 n=1 Tax=Papaver somniferum TaxID=3469 RepID=UPI000E6FBC48|nr:protein WVD2-like 7 isoform X2 [Papaver somniferum]
MVEQMAESFTDNQFERNEKVMASENDVSVSFGKFENDLLSWDKWSSFSQNKYLEEVEKCATPGSVASKKAYFEAHYKKIAARKAAVELLEQEQQLEGDSAKSNCRSNSGKQTQDEDDTFEFDLGRGNRTQGFRKCKLSLIHAAEPDADGVNCQVSVSQVGKEEMHSQQHNFTAEDLKASVSRSGEAPDEKSKTETEELETSTSVLGENQQCSQEINVRNTEMHSQEHYLKAEGLEASVSRRGETTDEKSKTETKELETSTSAQVESQQCSQEHNARNAETLSQQHNLRTKELEASVSVPLENPLERSKAQTVEEVQENQSVCSTPASVQEEKNMSTKSQEQVEVETQSARAQSETTSIGHVEEIESTTKLKPRKESRKVHPRIPATREKIPANAKKLATPKTKTAQNLLSKASKPSPSSPAISTISRTPARKDGSPSLLKNKQLFSPDKKRSTSLHMSLNAPPVKSDSSFLNTTRRSLIMEQMGDKDIVKRAFKAFRNTYGTPLSNGEGTSSTFQQLSERTSSSTTPQKDKKGNGMLLGKDSPHTKQVAARPTTIGSPVRPAGVKQTTTKASTTLRSEVKAEKHKEVLKTGDGKLKATEVDKPSRLRSKTKDVAHLNMSWR